MQDLHRHSLSVIAAAQESGADPEPAHKHLARGDKPLVYELQREPLRKLADFEPYLLEQIKLCPNLSGRRLLQQIREMGYSGGYSAVTGYLRAIRQPRLKPLEYRSEKGTYVLQRRVNRQCLVSIGSNLYSVPDTTRRGLVEVLMHQCEIRIFEKRRLIAVHRVLDGRNQRRIDPSHHETAPIRLEATPHATGPANVTQKSDGSDYHR